MTDRYSKKTLLIPRRTDYSAKQWAKKLLSMLLIYDWRMFKTAISDRDSKFLSAL